MLLRPLDATVLCFVAVGLLVLGVRRCLAGASGPPWSTAIVLGSGESPIRFSVPSCCAHNDKQVDTRVKCFGSPRSSRGKSTTLCTSSWPIPINAANRRLPRHRYESRAPCFRPILNRTISVGAQMALQPTEWVIIPRSREVGQSWSSSVLTTAYSLVFSTYAMLRLRPQVIICNGPGESGVSWVALVCRSSCPWPTPRHLLTHMLRGVCSSRPWYRALTHHFCGELLSGLLALADGETTVSHR